MPWGGEWTVSSPGKGTGNFQPWDVTMSWFSFAVITQSEGHLHPREDPGCPWDLWPLLFFFFPSSILCLVKSSEVSAASLGPAKTANLKTWIKASALESADITNTCDPLWYGSSPHTNPKCSFSSPFPELLWSYPSQLLGDGIAGDEQAIGKGVEGHSLIHSSK